MNFAKRLRELREEQGLSQTDLSKVLKVASATLSQYELDKRFPDQEMLNRLADFFGVSLDYLLGRSNQRNHVDKAFVKENINLIRGNMTFEEMSKDIATKLNTPVYQTLYSPDYLKKLSEGKEIPSFQRISLLSIYAQVSEEFFYSHNTQEDLEIAREEYKNAKLAKTQNRFIGDMNLDADLVEFITNPQNKKYLELARNVYSQGIDPDDIMGFSLKYRK